MPSSLTRFPQGKGSQTAGNQHGFAKVITIVLVVIAAAALGAGAYFGYNWWQDQAAKDTGQTAETPPATPPDPTRGWQTYTDSANGFSLKYPPDWTTKEGTFPSTHGQTLKDVAFLSPATEKVFVTVRTNPDGTLQAFVSADSVDSIQPAKVDTLDGFAASTADSYRVYLGKDDIVYMFTFPSAKTDKDLSADQVNVLTSFKFTSASSSTPSSTPSASATQSKVYASQLIGLKFSVLSSWGLVDESISANSGDTGKEYLLAFSDNNMVQGGSKTENYTSPRGAGVYDVSSVKRESGKVIAYSGTKSMYELSGYETVKKTKAGEVDFIEANEDQFLFKKGDLFGVIDLSGVDFKVLVVMADSSVSSNDFKAFLNSIEIP